MYDQYDPFDPYNIRPKQKGTLLTTGAICLVLVVAVVLFSVSQNRQKTLPAQPLAGLTADRLAGIQVEASGMGEPVVITDPEQLTEWAGALSGWTIAREVPAHKEEPGDRAAILLVVLQDGHTLEVTLPLFSLTENGSTSKLYRLQDPDAAMDLVKAAFG